MYWKRFGNILGDFGENWVQFGSKTGTPKLLKNTIVLYAYLVFYAYLIICVSHYTRILYFTYFTVLNVPNDRMTHPWS